MSHSNILSHLSRIYVTKRCTSENVSQRPHSRAEKQQRHLAARHYTVNISQRENAFYPRKKLTRVWNYLGNPMRSRGSPQKENEKPAKQIVERDENPKTKLGSCGLVPEAPFSGRH